MLHRHVATGRGWIEIGETSPILSGIVVLLLGCGLTYLDFGIIYPAKTRIYGPHGQETRASIANMKAVSRQNSITYLADIEYQDIAGQTHLLHQTYGFMQYLALKDERNAVVRFLRSDPDQAFEIHSKQGEKPNSIWYGLQCGALLGLGVVLILYGRARSRQEEPETEHTPAPVMRRPTGRPLG